MRKNNRSVKVCKACEHFTKVTWESIKSKEVGYECKFDNYSNSDEFVMIAARPMHFVRYELPEECPMKMEHMVVLDGKKS